MLPVHALELYSDLAFLGCFIQYRIGMTLSVGERDDYFIHGCLICTCVEILSVFSDVTETLMRNVQRSTAAYD